jgi:hypothetical protein
MRDIVFLTPGSEDYKQTVKRLCLIYERVAAVDLYAFSRTDWAGVRALYIGMHADQRHLAEHADILDGFVRRGGTVVVNGHVAYDFLIGLTPFRRVQNYRIEDLQVRRMAAHPVWDGVAEEEMTYRRGVAGFYGRGWHQPPEGATVIHCLGIPSRPIDFTYRLGDGRVLFHGGNDLLPLVEPKDTTKRIVPQLLDWLMAEERP